MRTVTINSADPEDIGTLVAKLAADVPDAYAKVQQAIGYLAQWNMPGYEQVDIWVNLRDLELGARYYHTAADSERAYYIAAIWHGDHFGFHS